MLHLSDTTRGDLHEDAIRALTPQKALTTIVATVP
jgi:hypothetical protein